MDSRDKAQVGKGNVCSRHVEPVGGNEPVHKMCFLRTAYDMPHVWRTVSAVGMSFVILFNLSLLESYKNLMVVFDTWFSLKPSSLLMLFWCSCISVSSLTGQTMYLDNLTLSWYLEGAGIVQSV
jgi:hypothetical protein